MHIRWKDISIDAMINLLHHKVSIFTHVNREFVGWVYTIDPITQSVVLFMNGNLITVIGEGIFTLTVLEGPSPQMNHLLESLLEEQHHHDPNYLQRRKSSLVAWLRQNRFPVRVDGQRIEVAKVLNIFPPYNASSCQTSNGIILGRVQRLIETMPNA